MIETWIQKIKGMAWFAGQHRNPKSSFNKQWCINAMTSLIFDRELMHDIPSALTYRAISNCNVVTRKYAHVWDIDILFNHWATQPTDQMLTNQDLQIKLASLLLSITVLSSLFRTEFWKPTSIAKISELLTILHKKIVIMGFTAYSIKHVSTTKFVPLGIQERDLNVLTNNAPDSKTVCNYYVFAANRQVNGFAARLVTIDHGLENQDSSTTNISQKKEEWGPKW
ncbi:MAG: hypothetical protein EZS28_030622 [Streblomastix strix]|uniref:Uncharacterized protein n=1 Tax=Streblomastix strix TaxID=222440 RepID=A0A5J4UTW3_9EUKA|nr:MAG: hypothetical protein EZS28_030622 [Streblomastix strix]